MGVVATDAIRARPAATASRGWWWLALVAGTACSLVLVELSGRVSDTAARRQVLDGWAGWASWSLAPTVTSMLVVVSAVGLVLAWLGGLTVLWRGWRPSSRGLALSVAVWAGPFVVLPPMLSRDVLSYVAEGQLLGRGLDPYSHTVAALGRGSVVLKSVDPLWRHTHTPYGPLALRLFEAAVQLGGSALGAVLLLRMAVAVSVAVACWCACRSVPGPRRVWLLWLLLGPLTLLHLLLAVHVDALVLAAVAASAWALVKDKPVLAAGLVTLAGGIKVTSLLLLVPLAVTVWRRAGGRALLRAGSGALCVAVLVGLLLPDDPLGFLRGLSTPGSVWDPFTPSTGLAIGLARVGLSLGVPAQSWVLDACHAGAVVLGLLGVATVVATHARRPATTTGGLLLLLVGVCGPVLWPWYLTPAVLLLALDPRLRQQQIAAGLAAWGSLLALPLPIVIGQRVAYAALAVLAVAWLAGGGRGRTCLAWSTQPRTTRLQEAAR